MSVREGDAGVLVFAEDIVFVCRHDRLVSDTVFVPVFGAAVRDGETDVVHVVVGTEDIDLSVRVLLRVNVFGNDMVRVRDSVRTVVPVQVSLPESELVLVKVDVKDTVPSAL